ncbi:glucose-1-phosphate thymidylyltransferase [Nocardiopsis sp. CC223A]|uniref:glucose-1-phosphate thymidylyltransferase n=1 Tax=Nocardiopsis sp. CC223A TaxID=3044051 RepID=UPI00278C55D8|nr:glucose-1-phosphate thymidylyltransferase [Nocardiopsis sp. CC223A]
MKALVLAGGSGTRLRPITHTSAKQLVPVGNKPVLFYALESIREAGITEVGLVVGEQADQIKAAVGDGSGFGLSITYLLQAEPLGLAHAVIVAREFLADEPFLMFLGDNFLIGGVREQVQSFELRPQSSRLLITRVRNPEQFGVAEIGENGRIISLEEKPEHPRSDLAIVGIYLFSADIHRAVSEIKASARGELEITDAIQWMIDQEMVIGTTVVDGYWKDTGNAQDMIEVNRLVLESVKSSNQGHVDEESELVGQVQIGEGSHIRDSRIVGPVVIGKGCVITDSYVGPYTSIADECSIEETEIEHSIVLSNASIFGIKRIGASMIGQHTNISPTSGHPREHRFILGDHSEIELHV